MRLLRLEEGDNVSLTDDLTHDIPPYAILSHTWGARGEEVIFQDIQNNDFQQKPGYGKILFCGRQAQLDGLDYFWVDTCCIDKTSSAELAESINSMYRWYENAQKCYVYLSDMSINFDRNTPPLLSSWLHGFQNSRWFTRGWTLQELLAPPVVEFFSSNGQKLGDKTSLEEPIHDITNVPILSLRNFSQSNMTLKTIFSWSQNRETTRPEDKVYSLLGLAGVYMPVIYGEGEGAAFLRLCAEVLQRHPRPGQSLLMFVARIGHAPALRILVRRRGSVRSKDKDGYSLLALAALNGHEAAIRMLLDEGANIESKNKDGDSPLGLAAATGQEAAISILLDKGANIESKNNYGNSPLGSAAWNGNKAVIGMLIDEGANIESKNNNGESPLGEAAWNGQEVAISILLDKGANIESKNNNGDSPLARAASYGHVAAIRTLLDRGANIESRDIWGASPLAQAAIYRYEAAMRMLLDKGANIESRNQNGDSPLLFAVANSHEAGVKILLDKGAKIESDMFTIIAERSSEEIKKLLENGQAERDTRGPAEKARGRAGRTRDPAERIRDPAERTRDPAERTRDPPGRTRDPAERTRDPAVKFLESSRRSRSGTSSNA